MPGVFYGETRLASVYFLGLTHGQREPQPLEPAHPTRYTAQMAHLHDSGYKYLFSHAELVQELLETFAPPGVSELLDYTTLRLESGNYVTPAMKPRADDIVWSVELQGRRIYLYLLLEFQFHSKRE
jgi:hypothetical protein